MEGGNGMTVHPIQGLMTTAMEHVKQMVDVNTILSDPILSPDGSVIITVSKASFGFAAGGSEFGKQDEEGEFAFGGGSGGGVSLSPVAFLILTGQGIKLLHLDEHSHLLDKIVEYAPEAIEKVQEFFQKRGDVSKSVDETIL